jgi:transcriptional regulator with XRE-family HTH domain
MDDIERRQILAAFLNARRMRLQPAEVNLPARRRRRTPGLRREEVAELANISVSWYTLLEQGQDVHPSVEVLQNLAQALRLSPADTEHLFLLARQEVPVRFAGEVMSQVTPAIERLIDSLSPNPAFVMNRRWDVLACNRISDLLFHFYELYPPHSPNIVWNFFVQDALYQTDSDRERQAKHLIARLQLDYVRYSDDAGLKMLIDDLQRVSPEFCDLWKQRDLRGLPDESSRSLHLIQHPVSGMLEFETVVFRAATTPDLRVKVYTALPATAIKLEQLLQATPEST